MLVCKSVNVLTNVKFFIKRYKICACFQPHGPWADAA